MPRPKHVGPCRVCGERIPKKGTVCDTCRWQIRKAHGQPQAYYLEHRDRITSRQREIYRPRRPRTAHRLAALAHYGARCADCGWDKAEVVLQAHHVDSNRENGNLSNLAILCPTCHFYRHFLEGSGVYAFYHLSD